MNESSNLPPIAALLGKINRMRADALKLDWSDDKMFTMAGRGGGYPYLSADKIKKQLSPLFSKHGLEFKPDFVNLQSHAPIGNMSQHWTVTLNATIIDCDTGEGITYVANGEAADSGDKGINKAQTCAFKQWALSTFLISDGIDPDAANSDVSMKFVPKTVAETEVIRNKLSEKAVAPSPISAKAESTSKIPESVPESVPAKEETEKTVSDDAAKSSYSLSTSHINAIAKLKETAVKMVAEGKIDESIPSEIDREMLTLSDGKQTVEFIKKYRMMLK